MKFRNILSLILFLFCSLSCLQEHNVGRVEPVWDHDDKALLDKFILTTIEEDNQPFDWNLASTDILHQGVVAANHLLTVGFDKNGNEILNRIFQNEQNNNKQLDYHEEFLVYTDEILNFSVIRIRQKSSIERLREMNDVAFLEVIGYPFDEHLIYPNNQLAEIDDISEHFNSRKGDLLLDPKLIDPSYPNQVANFDGGLGRVIVAHNMEEIYTEHKVFGDQIGVAVLDNGIVNWEKERLLNVGYGKRYHYGFFNKAWFFPWSQSDGIHPQPPDVLGLGYFVKGQWNHGSEQTKQVYSLAPNSNIYTVRCSPLVLVVEPAQIIGIIEAMKAMADNPEVNIISMSMGAIFNINIMKRAVDYFYDKNKLLFLAAGTSFDPFKSRIGVIFPANLDNTIACTGLEGLAENSGVHIAGDNSHVGPEVDFTVQYNPSSSEATSKMAGMAALVWSANPELKNHEVMDILIESAHFYQTQGQKHEKFGYGVVDVGLAVEKALEMQ